MKVSAVITTYKREACVVKRAIESVLNQSVKVEEVIVVDDNIKGSSFSRDLEDMIKEMPSQVVYVKQTEGNGNKGACEARNLGISRSHGDYIGFLDDDDWWLPHKIECQLDAFTNDIGLVFCCGEIHEETADGIRISDYFTTEFFKSEVSFHDMLMFDYVGSTSNPLIRRECFVSCGGFDMDMPARQDYEMWIRIAKKYRIVGLKEKLFIHTLHEGEQISRNSNKVVNGYLLILKKNKDSYKMDYVARYMKYRQLAKMTFHTNKMVFFRSLIKMLVAKTEIRIRGKA